MTGKRLISWLFLGSQLLISAETIFAAPPKSFEVSDVAASSSCEGKYIILKMDDLRVKENNNLSQSWLAYISKVKELNIKSSMGLIVEEVTKGAAPFNTELMSLHKDERFEVWHHGWDHKRRNLLPKKDNLGEFAGTPYEYQYDHLQKGIVYARDVLGIEFLTVGTPYNKSDETFVKVLHQHPSLKVWLYCQDESFSGLCLKRGPSNHLEDPIGRVSYTSFLTAYASSIHPYLVLQGHPDMWDKESFAQFEKVIGYLKRHKACFVLPSEYYRIRKG
ncbi:hypothetical protein [Gilvimarinus chinensis]|uniref:hypothetical protein n=1 Tax=Gilvimarinus chinensis TaxID=396005 RepID=UPI0003AA9829|nr:hypothetical protein [Gilvimarinus chinensis]